MDLIYSTSTRVFQNQTFVKGVWPDHFWIHPSKWSCWYQMKAHIFLIIPVKFYVQQMLLVKVMS